MNDIKTDVGFNIGCHAGNRCCFQRLSLGKNEKKNQILNEIFTFFFNQNLLGGRFVFIRLLLLIILPSTLSSMMNVSSNECCCCFRLSLL